MGSSTSYQDGSADDERINYAIDKKYGGRRPLGLIVEFFIGYLQDAEKTTRRPSRCLPSALKMLFARPRISTLLPEVRSSKRIVAFHRVSETILTFLPLSTNFAKRFLSLIQGDSSTLLTRSLEPTD